MKIISCFLTLLLIGCTHLKPTCDLADKYSEDLATGMARVFSCTNKEAIKKDIFEKVKDLNLCSDPRPEGPIFMILCYPISEYLSKKLIHGLPTRWECTGGGLGERVTASTIYNICSLIPF